MEVEQREAARRPFAKHERCWAWASATSARPRARAGLVAEVRFCSALRRSDLWTKVRVEAQRLIREDPLQLSGDKHGRAKELLTNLLQRRTPAGAARPPGAVL